MMLDKIKRYDWAILLGIALLIALYLWLSPIRVTNITMEDSYFPDRGEFEIHNSFRPEKPGGPNRKLLQRAEFDYKPYSQNIIHIRTLDCPIYARLNGKDMMPKLVSGNLCDDYNGAYFDISELVQSGKNSLEIKTRHTRSHHIVFFGFEVSSANLKSPFYFALTCLLFVIFFYCFFKRVVRSSLPIYALTILLIAILLRVYVVSNTHALERSHDVYGHIEYMNILIKDKALPKKQQCWSCYHPPYYFASMALGKAMLTGIGVSEFNVYQFLMLGSVVMYAVCLYFAFLTIQCFFKRPWQQIFSMGLFAFLPSSVIHSVAINNDLWMMTFFSIAFYYFVRWWQSKETNYYYKSLLFASLSIIIKASGIVMFALLGFFALGYALSRHRDFLRMVLRFSPAAVIMVATLLVNPMVDKIFRPPSPNMSGGIISNAAGLSGGLTVGNEPKNYLQFDVANFINRPFVHPLDDASGRQSFWETLLKTALYGEFRDFHAHNEGSQLRNAIAPVISLTFLLLISFMIVHAFLMRKEDLLRYAPLYALVLTCLTALIIMRSLIPSFPINDFRYIWAIMIAPCLLVPLAVHASAGIKRPMLSLLGYGSMALSISLSIVFSISLQ